MALKTSFCTIAYRHDAEISLSTILTHLADTGYDGAELWWQHVEGLGASQLDDVRGHAAQLGLAIPMLSPYLGNFNLEMTNRDEMIARTRAAAPVAVAIGAPLLRAFAGWTCECSSLTASDDYWRYNLAGFAEMARIADGYGLDIAIETHGGTLCDSVVGVGRFVEHCGPRIKVNLQLDDIAVNSNLPDGAAVYGELKDVVVHMHVPAMLPDPAGQADFQRTLAAMATDGFGGYVSAEHCKGGDEPGAVACEGIATLRALMGT